MSPETAWLMSRNWSVPAARPRPAPPAEIDHDPAVTVSLPAGEGLPTSWHVQPVGQLASAGGVVGVTGANAKTVPSPEPM